MFACLSAARKAAARILAMAAMVWLAACEPIPMGGGGPSINTSRPVQVALLVPAGSGNSSDAFLAQNFENAARMAIADLQGAQIDLRVYNTGADPATTAAVATQAVNDGAKIILGPLYAESANAAGLAVANRGINVLAFSNNTAIAGGNVFVLGATFENTANRLARYAVAQGDDRITIVHSDDIPGMAGRDAIASAVTRAGGTVAGVASYPLSQQGILNGARGIVSTTRSNGGEAIFMTAGVNADLPILATVLPENGLNPADTQYIGLTRWDSLPQTLALPGVQGGIFAVPDTAMQANFEARYAAAYGGTPHPLAGLAYDGIAAIGALVAAGNSDALTRSALTQAQGFQGTSGIFRLNANGTNTRGLAVATIQNNQVVILDPAPRAFGGAGL
ncbi:penicillin-binding protein activator [Loktanella sp. IMCC34160]|uniref:penicillin-binding protein activator n=1 Tax=Loktanella sp. IMCC34160 TaxID=2510646 RepID=UPI00101DF319|nr:penicillin-binding protein activator [Loktanella sp. IMCC34160]RYG93350.1 penicillin-binding protein activator [Loktanella sp. IMCC34160]